ncbi:Retrovirus-related Pol polyprotein from transposon 17.6 [Vitis vinifera]|uniref:Retrovirus-related Pol polyprotein from transposon 17.6 n=1 Tax=Vitis vinifera TaxID=29760 RepID=A0A438FDB3_VITVI|nr:Retrovirus-related Pol polyprotein from transposon 17.6 [Vitis vinifera]
MGWRILEVLCEFCNARCRAKFSHKPEQLASEGHIFLISAPNVQCLKLWILDFLSFEMLITPEEEEGPEEVCIIDTLVEEHCNQNMQDKLNESLGDLEEGLFKPFDVLATLQGISPLVCTHHIYMEEEAKPIRQPQRRLNPHLQEVVRAEVLKLLQAGIIYPISDTLGKLNVVTRKDHFPLPFIDQVLETVSGHPFYFLGRVLGYFQIEIDVEDQEKTTFTCPFGTYAYRRMPFGLCNAPATFQRCMLSIFSDMVERIMEVFMDDITIYGGTFEECLVNLEVVLNRCIEKDLVLNWEKCHFMVHQGIVLGHIISEKDIEVDKERSCAWPKRRWKALCDLLCKQDIERSSRNYTTTEKELSAVVFALDKFRAYLVVRSPNQDKKGVENVVADHLSRLAIAHNSHVLPINDDFPEESLMLLEKTPWYAHIANYLVTGEVPSEWKAQDRKHFFAKIHAYYWEEPFLFKFGVPKAIISDGGTHFCNRPFETLLAKYGVKHKVATPYHPQTSGQVELQTGKSRTY